MVLVEQFPVRRYTSASKIGNSVISLLCQLRCRRNTDHNKFSSLSNTTVVAIFPKLCFWRRSLCSNLRGIVPEKLYRATLNTSVETGFCLHKRINGRRGKLYNALWKRPFPSVHSLAAKRRGISFSCWIIPLRQQ